MPTIYIKNKIPELTKIASFIDKLGAEYNLSGGDIYDLNLAADEICTNIIHYAELNDVDALIQIDFMKIENWVTIDIKDEGKEFNPLEYETYDVSIDIDERPIGNLGILLVKSKMDEVKYARAGNKNILTMKKKLEN